MCDPVIFMLGVSVLLVVMTGIGYLMHRYLKGPADEND